jgi:hypothetical protein
MTRARSPSSTFIDTAPVLQAAANSPRGVRFRMPTWSRAFNFRQRCYRYRTALREEDAQRMFHIPGYLPSTPFDTLELYIESLSGENRTKDCPHELRSQPHDLVLRHKTAMGELLDADGNPIEAHEETYLSLDIE